MIEIRRRIHCHPELGLDTVATANLVEGELKSMGLTVRRPIAHGLIADIPAATGSSSHLLLRADMDGLPIQETENGLAFRSERAGCMHACGHDAHTAMLLGAARYLVEHRQRLRHPIRLMFQPGEEGPGGALPMIRAGVLDQVGRALMIHVDSELDCGTLATHSGPSWASTDDFHLVIHGRGGHGAHPDRGVDAIYVAATIIQMVQALVSRETDPTDPAVITFGTIHGGFRENIIASRVDLTGTIRCVAPENRIRLVARFSEMVSRAAEAMRATAELIIQTGYPPLVADPVWTEAVRQCLGHEWPCITLDQPSLGAEDFAYVCERVPGTALLLGVRSRPDAPGLHAPDFLLDESALVVGARALAAVALHASWAESEAQ
jgi:amidohydrolase